MRKKLFKWHSYGALIAMLPLLIISITGSILVFKVELDSLLRPEHMVVQINEEVAERVERKNLDKLMATVLNANQGYELGGWEIFDNKVRSDAGYLIKHNTEDWYKVYINQYSGELLSSPQTMTHYITDWLLELHYTFLLELNGAFLGFIFALFLLFLSISGIVLYKNFWKKIFTLRFHAAKRILYSDVHKLVGILSSPILIILAITGAYFNIVGILHEIQEHGDDADSPHVYMTAPLHSDSIKFEQLKRTAEQSIESFQANYLAIPHEGDEQIAFYGQVENGSIFNSEYSSSVSFDKLTGKEIHKADIREADFLTVFIDSFRKLHFGYLAGLFTQVLWCVLGFAPVILMVTGFYLFWSRSSNKKKSQLNRQRNKQRTEITESN